MGLHDGHRQRKRERFLKQGADGLADHEVLELLLYYAIPRRDTNELAHRLIQHFGTLDAVFQAPPEALMQVSGIGENAAVLLNLVPAAQRCARRSVSAERILNSVERCGAYFMDLLDGQRRELLYQVCLDGKGKVLSCKCLSQGSADMTSLSIRQVVENALLSGAAGVVLGHNHPSGVALPSRRTGPPPCRCGTLWPPWISACWTTSSWPTVISSPWRPAAFCTADPLKENSPSAPLRMERGAAMFSLHKIRTFVSKFIFTYGIFVVK